MKTTLMTALGFQPFAFTVTVETKEEAEMLRSLYSESNTLADRLNDATDCGWGDANVMFEELGKQAQQVLSR
jgi:hypothetical protein